MAMGRNNQQRQVELWVPSQELAKAPGHPFYEKVNKLLEKHGFDAVAEAEVLHAPRAEPGWKRAELRLESAEYVALFDADSAALAHFELRDPRSTGALAESLVDESGGTVRHIADAALPEQAT